MGFLPDWLTGFDRENFEAGQRADAANAAITRNLYEQGKIDAATLQEAENHYASGNIDPDYEIEAAFDEGLQEGAANVTAVISKPFEIAGTAVGSVLKALPWWLWIAGLAFLAFYLWPVLGPLLGARLKAK
jgi:hypothetical protein